MCHLFLPPTDTQPSSSTAPQTNTIRTCVQPHVASPRFSLTSGEDTLGPPTSRSILCRPHRQFAVSDPSTLQHNPVRTTSSDKTFHTHTHSKNSKMSERKVLTYAFLPAPPPRPPLGWPRSLTRPLVAQEILPRGLRSVAGGPHTQAEAGRAQGPDRPADGALFATVYRLRRGLSSPLPSPLSCSSLSLSLSVCLSVCVCVRHRPF